MAQRTVHGLVLETFVGPRPEDMSCRHLDGNKRNNQLGNLRWGTALEQSDDNRRNGVSNAGSRNGMSRLSEGDVLAINTAALAGAYRKGLAKKFDVSLATISRVITAATWKHIAIKRSIKKVYWRGEDSANAKLTNADVLQIL
jgi:hypothetical protein